MPPFFDRVQIHEAIQNQAVPTLEALAANDDVQNRSLRRFERDEPPPYTSSTESEDFDDTVLAPPQPRGELPEELKVIMEQPISEHELKTIVFAFGLGSILHPSYFYHTEAQLEENRIERYWNKIFRGLKGSRRLGVLVRHNVKRRWEKLGVWNPEWGFPGRKVQSNDYFGRWKWRWQQHNADGSESSDSAAVDAQQLLMRALHLRQNLHRGENSPVLPRSHLEQDATASLAESFIITRPWFIFQIEIAEEKTRYLRLSDKQQRLYPHSARKQVIKWWKERGDWREEFNRKDWVTSWKWRHESPSPEPEDLTPINNIRDNPLDTTDVDFTPSEIDDLETIELPRSEQPKNFWTIEEEDLPPYFPGQCADLAERAEKRIRHLASPSSAPRERSAPRWFPLFQPGSDKHEEPRQKEHECAPEELEKKASEPQQDPANPPPQKSQRQLRDKVNRTKAQDDPPAPRRSARIAGMKRSAEPLPSQVTPNKKHRGRAAMETTARAAQPVKQEIQRKKTKPVSARPSPKQVTGTRPRRGLDHLRKSAEVARARIKTGKTTRVVKTNAPTVPRRNGRPRKNEII